MDDDELAHEPDTQAGAMTNCECSACREARLQDDARLTYSARDVGQAYAEGWRDGATAVQRYAHVGYPCSGYTSSKAEAPRR